jgi:hypothetical protein
MGIGGSFLGGKRPGREAYHSPPTGAEVKKMFSNTSTPPIRLYDVLLNYLSRGTTLLYLPTS